MRFAETLQQIKKLSADLNLPECSSLIRGLRDKWSESSNSDEHRNWLAIVQSLTPCDHSTSFDPSMVLAKVAARAFFHGKNSQQIREKERKLREHLQLDMNGRELADCKRFSRLISDKAAELFPDLVADDKLQLSSQAAACLSQLGEIVAFEELCPHNRETVVRVKPIEARRDPRLHVLEKSPALKIINELISHLAEKI